MSVTQTQRKKSIFEWLCMGAALVFAMVLMTTAVWVEFFQANAATVDRRIERFLEYHYRDGLTEADLRTADDWLMNEIAVSPNFKRLNLWLLNKGPESPDIVKTHQGLFVSVPDFGEASPGFDIQCKKSETHTHGIFVAVLNEAGATRAENALLLNLAYRLCYLRKSEIA